MRTLIHRFLLWAPAAVGGTAFAAAGIWDSVKTFLASQAASAWSRMDDPAITLTSVLALGGYVSLVIWSGADKRVEPAPKKLSVQTPMPWIEARFLKVEERPDELSGFQIIRFYLVVGNTLPTGETIEDVTVFLRFLGLPARCSIRDSDNESGTIRHGEHLFFLLGELIGPSGGKVAIHGFETVSDIELSNARNGHWTFFYKSAEAPRAALGGPNEATFPMIAVVAGKGMVSETIWVDVTMSKLEEAVTLRLPPKLRWRWVHSAIQSVRKAWTRIAARAEGGKQP